MVEIVVKKRHILLRIIENNFLSQSFAFLDNAYDNVYKIFTFIFKYLTLYSRSPNHYLFFQTFLSVLKKSRVVLINILFLESVIHHTSYAKSFHNKF